MYKKACLFLLVTVAFFDAVKPMERLIHAGYSNCQPIEIINALWYEYKPVIYTSVAVVVGSFFVYDFFSKRQRIKRLEIDVEELQRNRTTTAILSEVHRVENRVDLFEKNLITADSDLTYLYEYVITVDAIQQFNKIENAGKSYIERPRIPQFKNKSIIDLFKEFNARPSELSEGHFQLATLPSPRRRSNSPPNSFSPRKFGSDKPRTIKRQDSEKEKIGEKEKTSPRKGDEIPHKGDEKEDY